MVWIAAFAGKRKSGMKSGSIPSNRVLDTLELLSSKDEISRSFLCSIPFNLFIPQIQYKLITFLVYHQRCYMWFSGGNPPLIMNLGIFLLKSTYHLARWIWMHICHKVVLLQYLYSFQIWDNLIFDLFVKGGFRANGKLSKFRHGHHNLRFEDAGLELWLEGNFSWELFIVTDHCDLQTFLRVALHFDAGKVWW